MIRISKNYFFAAVIFALLATVLIVSWFRYGFLYGGGDVGIPSYNPQRIVDIAKYVWWEAGAPGNLVPHGVTSLPVQLFQSALAFLGLPYFVIQATLFWILLFLTGCGMFLVGLSVFGKDKLLLPILCGLFYMFNPYMMIQVWHRFIYNSFFLAAFLPFFYLFWDDWIKRGRFVSILLFLVFNIFGVYLYGTIAYIITVIFVLFFIFLKYGFIPWQGFNNFKKITFRFITGLILWILIHTWWILPTFSIGPALFSTQHRTFDSVTTLITLSKQTGIPYTLSGINPFYLFEQADFGEIYKSPLFLIIMFVPLFLLIPGFVVALRSRILCGWGTLSIIAGLVSKGAASPFGFIYIFAFTKVFALGVLRNPFEKMGILLPFSLAIVYTLGFNWYLNKFKDKRSNFIKLLLGSLLLFQLGLFLWPMWTGKLIGKFDKLALVDVPEYYRQTDDFLKLQKKEGKILHLPLPVGESISYSWPHAFSGVESSPLLFSSLPSISRGANIKHVDDIISAASNIFREEVADETIIAILQSLNVRFLVLHKDIIWQGGFLDNPVKLEGILDSRRFLEKKGTFGELVVYELIAKYFKPRIYATAYVNSLSRGEKNSFWPFILAGNKADLISPVTNKDRPNNPLQTLVVPAKSWTFHPKNLPLEKAITELPAASKILPGSRLYFLIKLKEDFKILTSLGPDRLKVKLNFLGKRLIEAIRLKEQGKLSTASIDAYRRLLVEVFYKDNLKDQLDFIGGRGFINDIFDKHLVILNMLDRKDTKEELLKALRSSELVPEYDVEKNKDIPDLEYTTYHFQVPSNNEYELLMANSKVRDVYPGRLEKVEFQIDGQQKELTSLAVDDFLSYGKIKLGAGQREITLAATPSVNLFDYPQSSNIEISSTGSQKFETHIAPLTADTWYTVKFEAKVLSGSEFKIQLIADGKVEFEKFFTNDNSKDWIRLREDILFTKPAVTYGGIRFLVDRSNTSVIFRNIRIERLLNNPIFLRSSANSVSSTDSASNVEFRQYSPIFYSGKIKLDREGFIIFSESFHKDWQLKLSDSQRSFIPEGRYLANMYANAWFIPEGGEYNFELEFTPQMILYKGLIISGVSFLSAVVVYLTKLKNDQTNN